ncbi:PHP domain-containing protein [Leeia sp. TBRC 13508]|uniref:PHP domain-containing protein n=1 Tax=Leeia speluncae TaxID=2884804 RepID=A0ABS8DAW5_9NEIS|nr:3',5'-nucleoside bisphosphate phosphatase [Leeia speluncae]MCB6185355.1 PHP domain-containing protein [Leeia speluncae]
MNIYDFHCHSNVSDGLLTPAAVVERAFERGIRALALTDHDEVGGLTEAQETAARLGMVLVNGVEISVNWGKHTLHIVGLGVDPKNNVLQEGLARIRSGRTERAKMMAAGLAKAGIQGAFEGALPYADNPEMIGRAHFARFLVENGHARNLQAVFKKFLVPGKPGYVPHLWATLQESIDWIHAAGGLAVIAHPGRYEMGKKQMLELVEIFTRFGGDGVEVATGNHTPDLVARFARIADDFGLWASVGSDFHGTGHYGDLGTYPPLPSYCKPIWEKLGISLPESPACDAIGNS